MVQLPPEILEVALRRQVEQGNTLNASRIHNDRHAGGFDWIDTEEGNEYWSEIMYQYYVPAGALFHPITTTDSQSDDQIIM